MWSRTHAIDLILEGVTNREGIPLEVFRHCSSIFLPIQVKKSCLVAAQFWATEQAYMLQR
jgi:hypothetical protein